MLISEYPDGLERMLYATALREWLFSSANTRNGWMDLPGCFLKWTEDHEKARDMERALKAAQQVCESYRLRHAAESMIENVKHDLDRRKEAAAESKEAATE